MAVVASEVLRVAQEPASSPAPLPISKVKNYQEEMDGEREYTFTSISTRTAMDEHIIAPRRTGRSPTRTDDARGEGRYAD
ncbi:MAG: hypothetical protein ACJ797_06535 [Ktedonobacteraceae bacterium]